MAILRKLPAAVAVAALTVTLYGCGSSGSLKQERDDLRDQVAQLEAAVAAAEQAQAAAETAQAEADALRMTAEQTADDADAARMDAVAAQMAAAEAQRLAEELAALAETRAMESAESAAAAEQRAMDAAAAQMAAEAAAADAEQRAMDAAAAQMAAEAAAADAEQRAMDAAAAQMAAEAAAADAEQHAMDAAAARMEAEATAAAAEQRAMDSAAAQMAAEDAAAASEQRAMDAAAAQMAAEDAKSTAEQLQADADAAAMAAQAAADSNAADAMAKAEEARMAQEAADTAAELQTLAQEAQRLAEQLAADAEAERMTAEMERDAAAAAQATAEMERDEAAAAQATAEMERDEAAAAQATAEMERDAAVAAQGRADAASEAAAAAQATAEIARDEAVAAQGRAEAAKAEADGLAAAALLAQGEAEGRAVDAQAAATAATMRADTAETERDAAVTALTAAETARDAAVAAQTVAETARDAAVKRAEDAEAELAEIEVEQAEGIAAGKTKERIAREAEVRMAITMPARDAQDSILVPTNYAARMAPSGGDVAVTAKRNASGMVAVDVNGDDDDVYDGGDANAHASGWTAVTLTRTNAADDSTDTVVIYTDISAPDDAVFIVHYDRATRDNILNDADRVKLAMADEFPTGRTETLVYGEVNDVATGNPARFSGTFADVSGNYECTAAGGSCTITTDAKGVMQMSEDWRFTPNSNTATVKVPDANYAWFGWWLNKPKKEGDDHDVDVFSGHTTDYDAEVMDEVEGTVNYAGTAAGKYVTKSYTAGVHDDSGVGHFTARAALTAKFGADDAAGAISGAISNFIIDDDESRPWKVTLEEASLTDGIATFGNTTEVDFGGGPSNSDVGRWQGSFYGPGEEDEDAPGAVGGIFDAIQDNAALIGAFGASKQ